jgi:hypothetical protein
MKTFTVPAATIRERVARHFAERPEAAHLRRHHDLD